MSGQCPICDRYYQKAVQHVRRNTSSHHHLFPKKWFDKNGPQFELCQECHDEFNELYPMDHLWSPAECVTNFISFCYRKGKNALVIYKELVPIYKQFL